MEIQINFIEWKILILINYGHNFKQLIENTEKEIYELERKIYYNTTSFIFTKYVKIKNPRKNGRFFVSRKIVFDK